VDRPLRDVTTDDPRLASALAAALDGSGPAVRPVPPGGAGSDERTSDERVPTGVAVVLRTSGSTGAPRDVMLSATALRASAAATRHRLGGPGDWLLALPPDHVAGLQVLLRALAAGTGAHRMPPGPFRAAGFAQAAAALPPGRRYTSLVPTQLVRLLDDAEGRAALRSFDAVLLGGAAVAPALLERAREAGARVVTTYGMTETCGGCVYDGVPLDGVRVSLDPDRRILLAGPVLADGYLGEPGSGGSASRLRGLDGFVDDEGTRWLRTADLGRLSPDGRLDVLGRADDVILTGGVNVAPGPVEHLLATLPGVREACVVGVPDEEWGQAVVAVLVVGPQGPPSLDSVRALVGQRLGPTAAPRRLLVVPALPLRGPGKPDRRATATLAAAIP
jgi:O-succinylbenzoic acid--CoA ligase